jgi:hypothetical protein
MAPLSALRNTLQSHITLTRRELILLALILLVFGGLGALYSASVPVFETPDEPRYYAQAEALVQGVPFAEWAARRGLPQRTPMPPLYPALASLVLRAADIPADGPLVEANPYTGAPGDDVWRNRNAILHLADDGPQAEAVREAIYRLRALSLVLAALAVALTALLARALMPEERGVPLAAAILVAFMPQYLFATAAATPMALTVLLVTAILYLCVRLVGAGDVADGQALALGILVALAALASLLGLVAGLLALLPTYAMLWLAHRHPPRDLLRPLGISLGAAVFLGGWWYVRLMFGADASWQALLGTGLRAPEASGLSMVRRVLTTYWGTFGWGNVLGGEAYYSLGRLLGLLTVGGVALWFIGIYWQRRWRHATEQGMALGYLWLLIVAVLGGYGLVTVALGARDGRALYPVVAGLSVLLAAGLLRWARGRQRAVVSTVLGTGLMVVAALVPIYYIQPVYALPQRTTLEHVPAEIQPLDIAFGDADKAGLVLLGYRLPDAWAVPGEPLWVELHWLGRRRMTHDHVVTLSVWDESGVLLDRVRTHPGGGTYPTRRWLPGDVVIDEYALVLPEDLAGSHVALDVAVAAVDPSTGALTPVQPESITGPEHVVGQPLETALPLGTVPVLRANASGGP